MNETISVLIIVGAPLAVLTMLAVGCSAYAVYKVWKGE